MMELGRRDVQDWDELCTELKSLVNSVQYGLPLDQIKSDYWDSEERDLDEAMSVYGFESLAELLAAVGIVCLPRQVAAEQLHLPWPPRGRASSNGSRDTSLDGDEPVLLIPHEPGKLGHLQHLIRGQHYSAHTRLGGIHRDREGNSYSRSQRPSRPTGVVQPIARKEPQQSTMQRLARVDPRLARELLRERVQQLPRGRRHNAESLGACYKAAFGEALDPSDFGHDSLPKLLHTELPELLGFDEDGFLVWREEEEDRLSWEDELDALTDEENNGKEESLLLNLSEEASLLNFDDIVSPVTCLPAPVPLRPSPAPVPLLPSPGPVQLHHPSPANVDDSFSFTEEELLRGFGTMEPENLHSDITTTSSDSLPSPHEEPIVLDPQAPGVVEPPEPEAPLMGRIRLPRPPLRLSIPNNNIEPWLWRRVYGLLRVYASRDEFGNHEWLRLETFNEIYLKIFGESFRQADWYESDLLVIFGWFHEWVRLDIDPAGFAWVNLREEAIRIRQGKVHEICEKVREARRKFMEEDYLTPISVTQNGSSQDCAIKNKIYRLLIEQFQSGMDSTQLRHVYQMKYPQDPPLRTGNELDFCENFLTDICKFDRKSPVHGLLYPRLDVDFHVPEEFDWKNLVEARKMVEKEVERRLGEKNPVRVQVMGRFFTHYE